MIAGGWQASWLAASWLARVTRVARSEVVAKRSGQQLMGVVEARVTARIALIG